MFAAILGRHRARGQCHGWVHDRERIDREIFVSVTMSRLRLLGGLRAESVEADSVGSAEPYAIQHCRWLSRLASIVAVVLGCLVLAGWVLNDVVLRAFMPG